MQFSPPPTDDQLARLTHELAPGGHIDLRQRLLGGLDNTMDVLDLRQPGGTTRRVVLRRYGPYHTGSDVAQREIDALQIAARGSVPAPQPIWMDEAGIFDRPAIVISYIEGALLLLPDDPFDWADQMAATLAQIHDCPLEARDLKKLRDYRWDLLREIHQVGIPQKYADHSLGPGIWNRLGAEAEQIEAGETTFLHTDYHPGQVLWRDGRLVGVVDWPDAGYGEPASDVAYCLCDFNYCGYPAAGERFVETYRSITGRTLDSLQFWLLVAVSRPLPDVARWAPSWHAVGRTDLTVDILRQRHNDLIERALAE